MFYVLLLHQLMMFEDPKYTYDSFVYVRPPYSSLVHMTGPEDI
jgi:hypothetical protein